LHCVSGAGTGAGAAADLPPTALFADRPPTAPSLEVGIAGADRHPGPDPDPK